MTLQMVSVLWLISAAASVTAGAEAPPPCGALNARELWTVACLRVRGLAWEGYKESLAVGMGENNQGLTESLVIMHNGKAA